MSHVGSAIVFVACLTWIGLSFLPGHAAAGLSGWDWLAVIGAVISFFSAVDE